MTDRATTVDRRDSNNIVRLTMAPKDRRYVEGIEDEDEDRWMVHVGHITDGGRWPTAPHAHSRYSQVILVRSGCGRMNLEGCSVPFAGPCALLLPADCMHDVDYEIDADRWVVTIEATYLTQVNGRLPEFIQLWAVPRMISLSHVPEVAMDFYSLVRRLEKEMESRGFGHVVETEAVLSLLLLALVRGISLDQVIYDGVKRSEIGLTERFRTLIGQHYRQNLPLRDYASMMAVSVTQLRAACASATGQSPTKMIHARLVTEAKRQLIFGDMSIEQIAFSLGFSHASYFTRFFGKEVGQTPGRFRIRSRGEESFSAVPRTTC
jgi:AraC family transcriptional activator of pobA